MSTATLPKPVSLPKLDPKFRKMLMMMRVACEAIGVQSRQISIKNSDQIEIEDFGVSVTRKDGDVNGSPAKVWVVTERYKVFALMRKPREREEDVLTASMDDVSSVAAKVAEVCARQMIELAIDAELS